MSRFKDYLVIVGIMLTLTSMSGCNFYIEHYFYTKH